MNRRNFFLLLVAGAALPFVPFRRAPSVEIDGRTYGIVSFDDERGEITLEAPVYDARTWHVKGGWEKVNRAQNVKLEKVT
jgi:hypothetical protein